jgi:ribonuclease HI
MGRRSAFPRKSQWATVFADASVRRDDGYAGVGLVLARFDEGEVWHQFTALVPRSHVKRRHDVDPLYAEMYGCVLGIETALDLWWHDIQGVHLRCDNKNAVDLLTAAERLHRKGAGCAAFDALTRRPDIRELLIWRSMLPTLCSPRWVPGHQKSCSKAAKANRLADRLSRLAG